MNQPHISVFHLLVENMPQKKALGKTPAVQGRLGQIICSLCIYANYMWRSTASHIMSGGGSNHLQPLIQLFLMMFLTPKPPKVQQGIYQ